MHGHHRSALACRSYEETSIFVKTALQLTRTICRYFELPQQAMRLPKKMTEAKKIVARMSWSTGSNESALMSAIGPKRTFPYVAFDVAFGGKADMGCCSAYVRF